MRTCGSSQDSTEGCGQNLVAYWRSENTETHFLGSVFKEFLWEALTFSCQERDERAFHHTTIMESVHGWICYETFETQPVCVLYDGRKEESGQQIPARPKDGIQMLLIPQQFKMYLFYWKIEGSKISLSGWKITKEQIPITEERMV